MHNANSTMTREIIINSQVITQVKSTQFLGVLINEKMSRWEHISSINRKIAKGIGIIYKAHNLLNQSTCISLYFAFIYPFLVYCVGDPPIPQS